MPSELPAGMVTIADLYRELVGMRQDVGKALVRIEVIDSRNTNADKLHADYETRIRSLERFKYLVMGGAALVGGGGGWLAQWLASRH